MSGRRVGGWRRSGAALVAVVVVGLAIPAGARAQETVPARASVTPGMAKIGERVIYRGEIHVSGAWMPRFLPPEPESLLTWGTPRVRHLVGRPPARRWGEAQHRPGQVPWVPDTFVVEIPLQAFATGSYTLPGLRFFSAAQGNGSDGRLPRGVLRMPQVHLLVVPTLTAADSNATLREVHGPLAAPWWERVPWLWVAVGLALVAAIVWLVRRLRRRRPAIAAPAVPVAAPRRDPVLEALAALEALRRDRLPEAGRFAEHAFELGRILRRFLEATTGVTRPGDTTPELVSALRASQLAPDDIQRLAGLLRGWDRVKFAREPVDAASAHRDEDAVESFVRSAATSVRGTGAAGKAVA